MSPAKNLNPSGLSRRNVIVWGGAGVAAAATVALVGCSTGSGDDSATTGPPTEIAQLSDIPVGGSIVVMANGQQIVLSQPEAGTVTAFSAVCPHQGCLVAGRQGELVCPCHRSRFDTSTGDVLQGPATRALSAVDITVDGTTISTA
ncbi:Rieske (2Fe-2S) protein [Cryobacterium sp. CG_9.6]|uniref:Rieske (2Fe-2S) protein n=1 Tax=Cryobacterium sp. CG_9.6 TaxID=2760710 RepID=UPI0024732D84|nr:Rieske (2Fe-2S) protein [Cryobacterium sp. CG_9.6]MDH6237425.1 Rieske Fe-S protein [Cryobacterium sp. CG_9.6]